jgi:predicted nucleic acid-binding protein
MYAVGADHPYKASCAGILLGVARREIDVVTDCEVVQEILYRYTRLGRRNEGIQVALDLFKVVLTVLPVGEEDVRRAIGFMETYRRLSPRDAIHAAVMLNNGVSEILSVDRDFDAMEEVRRVDPGDLAHQRQ